MNFLRVICHTKNGRSVFILLPTQGMSLSMSKLAILAILIFKGNFRVDDEFVDGFIFPNLFFERQKNNASETKHVER